MSADVGECSCPPFCLSVKVVPSQPAPSLKRLHALKQADGQWPVSEHKCVQEMQIVIPANKPLWMIDEVEFPFGIRSEPKKFLNHNMQKF